MFDYDTHYTGYYGSEINTVYLTGVSGTGSPYVIFGGFPNSAAGQTVKIEVDGGLSGGVYTISYQGHKDFWGDWVPMYNFNGTRIENNPLGLVYSTSLLPKGTFKFTLITGTGAKTTYTIIKTF